MHWAESAGRVLAIGDAAPVAEVVAHWPWAGAVVVYAGESLPERRGGRVARRSGRRAR
jgi:hypothetical protein